jgi:Zinc carboxypeptidase/Cytosolic carboxypeptidase N-terminal domain
MTELTSKNRPEIENQFSYITYKPSKFKYEQGGMLVYDVAAAILKYSSKTVNLSIPVISNQSKRLEIPSQLHCDNISEQDLELYEKIKQMPPCPSFPSNYLLYIPDDKITLTFNSKFESGNLSKAIKMSDYEYNLMIRSDLNSSGNNHWYYFSVYNPRKTSVTFNIVNMKKNDILYKSGMKPVVLSQKSKENNELLWHRDCVSISYKNNTSNYYYTLSFTYNFKYESDLVYFAYAVPYTYTDLSDYLKKVSLDYGKIARVDTLCYSLAGNPCEVLTITKNILSYPSQESEHDDYQTSFGGRKLQRLKKKKLNKTDYHKEKKGIVLTARVHSGETVSSFMVQGAIDFLLSDCKKAKLLRKNFVFKIVPMLNPDGVRYGSYRCSLLGVDLNRRWDNPSKYLHPTIYNTKKMIQVFNEVHKIQLFCDMHGHTRKRNVFMYGCSYKNNDYLAQRKNHCVKVIPILMESNKFFKYSDCHFRMESYKMSTARIVVYSEFDVLYSYTMEASFYGPRPAEGTAESFGNDYHMNEAHLATLGQTLCGLCSIFLSENVFYSKLRLAYDYISQKIQANKNPELKPIEINDNDAENKEFEYKNLEKDVWDHIKLETAQESEDSGGSDSEPDERLIPEKPKRSRSTTKQKKSPERHEFTRKSEKKEENERYEKYKRNYSGHTKFCTTPKLEILQKRIIGSSNKLSKPSIESNNIISSMMTIERNNKFLSIQSKKTSKKLDMLSELPKISVEGHNRKPKNNVPGKLINFINYNWAEIGVQNIFNSLSKPTAFAGNK